MRELVQPAHVRTDGFGQLDAPRSESAGTLMGTPDQPGIYGRFPVRSNSVGNLWAFVRRFVTPPEDERLVAITTPDGFADVGPSNIESAPADRA
jgi:hypothetical protein